MRRLLLSLSAATLVVPMGLAPDMAQARRTYHRTSYSHVRHCRHSAGTTGGVIGGVTGAVVGHGLLGHGLLGAGAGAAGGYFAGRAVDRSMTARRRCS